MPWQRRCVARVRRKAQGWQRIPGQISRQRGVFTGSGWIGGVLLFSGGGRQWLWRRNLQTRAAGIEVLWVAARVVVMLEGKRSFVRGLSSSSVLGGMLEFSGAPGQHSSTCCPPAIPAGLAAARRLPHCRPSWRPGGGECHRATPQERVVATMPSPPRWTAPSGGSCAPEAWHEKSDDVSPKFGRKRSHELGNRPVSANQWAT